jgi:Transglutaminase-like superfamily
MPFKMSELREKKLNPNLLLPGRAMRKIFRDPGEAVLLIRMGAWVLLLSSLIKVQSLPRALQFISTPVRGRSADEQQTATRLAQAVDVLLAMNIFVYRPRCWKRAAILHRYLALHGIDSQINFGMRKEVDGTLSGHAWLERGGAPILEPTVPNYSITFSFPADVKQTVFTFPLET